MERDTAKNDALQKRIAHFRKAFAKGLGHKPTTLQAAAIDRAARLTTIAEAVAANPDSTVNDIVRSDGVAHRARDAMHALLRATKPKPVKMRPLSECLASARAPR
jgi:hypothetical protein